MGLKQQMKQTLGMTMTPQLQQAIKILQMSVMELQQEVNKELMENPTLEEHSGDEGGEDPKEAAGAEAPETAQQQKESAELEDWQKYIEQSQSAGDYKSTRNTNVDDVPTYEQIHAKPETLYDHLMWQLRMQAHDEKELFIGEEIIGNLNDDGYLMVLLEEIAGTCSVDVAEVEAVLYKVQRFDPPGVAARELKECLLIQLEILEEDDACEMIVENHLAELETKNYALIAKSMNLSLDYVKELCKVVHGLEPKPGRSFVHSEPVYFVPDVYVLKVGDEYMVVLNEDRIPRLQISKDYQQQLSEGQIKGQAKTYVKDKMKGAAWLIKSIIQRQKSIYRVTQAIVSRQRDFFDHGPQHLKPMVLRDIAEELELHESTISRVTTNKFVHTPHGIFELKYFFNSAIKRSDGEADMASESVKQKIKSIITSENTKNPFSDQQIADMLKEDNINIARRTVAKYREALGVLPSSKRKKFF
ncbi:MAG TPA: RNA polymerase factor sigma-54 [Bdellovibrionota bacterium]|nr:RNA polymerase factor sigma-54 [Bdellovibrionota bacterium]